MPDTYLVTAPRLRWYLRGMNRRVQDRACPFHPNWFERVQLDVDDSLSRISYENATAEYEGWKYMDKLYRRYGRADA